jgi:hypothetical protein
MGEVQLRPYATEGNEDEDGDEDEDEDEDGLEGENVPGSEAEFRNIGCTPGRGCRHPTQQVPGGGSPAGTTEPQDFATPSVGSEVGFANRR